MEAYIENLGEFVGILENPMQNLGGLELLEKQLLPLAMYKTVDPSRVRCVEEYLVKYPTGDHYWAALSDVSLPSFPILLNVLRLTLYHAKSSNKSSLQLLHQILPGQSKMLLRALHTNNPHLQAHVLALLAAVAKQGKFGADLVREHFDFTIKPLAQKCPFNYQKLSTNDWSMYSVRQIFIDFILTLVENGSFETKESICKLKGLIQPIFKLLSKDHPMMQRRVLECFKNTCCSDEGYSLAVAVFNAPVLLNIVGMYEQSREAEYLQRYLEDICTVPGRGVCFQVDCTLDLKNRILLDLLPALKPLESEKQQDLAIGILQSCTDLLSPYLEGINLSLFHDLDNPKWTALMAFIVRILKLPLPEVRVECLGDLTLCKYMPPRSVTSKAIDLPSTHSLYCITLLSELSERLFAVIKRLEAASSLNERDMIVKRYLETCPDTNHMYQTFLKVQEIPEDSQVNVVTKTRFYNFIAYFMLVEPLEKISLDSVLELAIKSRDEELRETLISKVAFAIIPPKTLNVELILSVRFPIVPVLKGYLLREGLVSAVKADALAKWADANRTEFFSLLSKEKTSFESLIPAPVPSDVAQDIKLAPQEQLCRKQKRPLQVDDVEEWSGTGIFHCLGREKTLFLLKHFDPNDLFLPVETFEELKETRNIGPFLQLVGIDTIDQRFCSEQLPIVILGLSSKCQIIRGASFALLDRLYTSVDNAMSFKERRQLKLLLTALKNSIPIYNQEQPLPLTMFAAMSCPLITSPSHPLYPLLNDLFLKKATLPSAGIPFFDELAGFGECLLEGVTFLLRMCDNLGGKYVLPEWQLTRLALHKHIIPAKHTKLIKLCPSHSH